jgi:hypothetical protein
MRRVLAVILVLWEPLTLALAASTLLRRITEHGVPAYAVLVVKVFVAGVGIAAGMALWQERPGAMVLARWALALSLATTLFSRLTDFWPATLPVESPVGARASVAWTGGWLVWSLRQPGGQLRRAEAAFEPRC